MNLMCLNVVGLKEEQKADLTLPWPSLALRTDKYKEQNFQNEKLISKVLPSKFS